MCGFLEYSQTCALIITTYISTIFITLKGNAACSGNHSPFLSLARRGQPQSTTPLLSVPIDLPLLNTYMEYVYGIIQYVTFCLAFLSLNV